MLEKHKIREEFWEFFLCYSRAAQMHEQVYDGAVNMTGKTNDVASSMQGNNQNSQTCASLRHAK